MNKTTYWPNSICLKCGLTKKEFERYRKVRAKCIANTNHFWNPNKIKIEDENISI